MDHVQFKFSGSSVDYYFDASFSYLKKLTDPAGTIIITDENVFNYYEKKFKGWNCIVLKPGEEFKVQATADSVIEQLIKMECDRKSTVVGVGGGVITDITGYVASVYMRGIRFGFVPTSLLAMVDAAIGGKNGIDIGIYKNMVGSFRHPAFILHDLIFLNTLPPQEWTNGFAEIIKHACIKDAVMFKELQTSSVKFYQAKKKSLRHLIHRNAILKTRIVQKDEFENGERKLLNFGHTIGHALENQYELSHGQAISIGMAYASIISEKLTGFREVKKVVDVIQQYGLPAFAHFDNKKVFKALKMDKKRESKEIKYILLRRIGAGEIRSIPIMELQSILESLN